MSEKLKELKSKCSDKEAKFLELWFNGQQKFNAYNNAGFKAKNTKVASAAICRLLKKVNCSAYLEALKNDKDSELQRKNKITRTMQLNRLSTAYELARAAKNPSAMVSAVREANEMLGFHRDSAPNPERELAIRQRAEAEQVELQAIARRRTISIAGANKGQSDAMVD